MQIDVILAVYTPHPTPHSATSGAMSMHSNKGLLRHWLYKGHHGWFTPYAINLIIITIFAALICTCTSWMPIMIDLEGFCTKRALQWVLVGPSEVPMFAEYQGKIWLPMWNREIIPAVETAFRNVAARAELKAWNERLPRILNREKVPSFYGFGSTPNYLPWNSISTLNDTVDSFNIEADW